MGATHVFDEGIGLTPADDGVFTGSMHKRWWIDRGPNGGFLASVLLNAMTQAVADAERQPCSLTVQYVARPAEGAVEVVPQIERVGRSMTAITARMYQEGALLAIGQATFSKERSGLGFSDDPMPSTPAPEDIPELPVPPETFPPFSRQFDYRWALGDLPYTSGESALTGGWIRPKGPRPIDAVLLATYADAWPPAVFSRLDRPHPVPTIDLTVHFRSWHPPPGRDSDWCFVRFSSATAAGGFIEEDGTIWGRDGTLLAHSRQLALFG